MLLGVGSTTLMLAAAGCRRSDQTDSSPPPETETAKARSDEAAMPSSGAPSEPATDSATGTAPNATTGEPTAEADMEICVDQLLSDEELQINACERLPMGRALEGGARADVFRVAYEDEAQGEIVGAYLVLQVGDEMDATLLGEQIYIPGEETDFALGQLEVRDGVVVMPVTESVTTIGNTGNPDADPEEDLERTRYEGRCYLDDILCERVAVEP